MGRRRQPEGSVGFGLRIVFSPPWLPRPSLAFSGYRPIIPVHAPHVVVHPRPTRTEQTPKPQPLPTPAPPEKTSNKSVDVDPHWYTGHTEQHESPVFAAGPEDFAGWQRPFKRFRAAPHDVWLMSQPVVHNNQHVWVSDTGVYTLPLYRISGMYAPANAEFSTQSFAVPATGLAGTATSTSFSGHFRAIFGHFRADSHAFPSSGRPAPFVL